MLHTICIIVAVSITFGLSLFLQEKVLFASKNPLFLALFSIVKLLLLAKFFYIILKSNQIHPIILVAVFLLVYWLTIFIIKEFIHARS